MKGGTEVCEINRGCREEPSKWRGERGREGEELSAGETAAGGPWECRGLRPEPWASAAGQGVPLPLASFLSHFLFSFSLSLYSPPPPTSSKRWVLSLGSLCCLPRTDS